MIRSVTTKNESIAKQILAVQQAAYLQESILIDYPKLPPLLETLADIQGSSENFIVYQVGEKIVGVLSYAIENDTLTIARLVAHPHFARRGIGQALLEEILKHPTIRHFVVGTAQKNIPAIKLYEKHGFAITQQQTLPDGLVLVRLEKHQS
jgi:ribosomal protein S18 acetylase RimI-like enzyme